MAKIWQKMKKKALFIVQRKFNMFLHGTAGVPETQISGTRSATTKVSHLFKICAYYMYLYAPFYISPFRFQYIDYKFEFSY